MDNHDQVQAKWDKRYRSVDHSSIPCALLRDNLYLLPDQGRALDLACGTGGNALQLAREGLDVSAWDISAVAIDKLKQSASEAGLVITTTIRDVVKEPPAPNSFDIIVVSHFLERSIADALVAALRDGGLLFYQTFSQSRITGNGPENPAFRLQEGELLVLFSALKPVYYRENRLLGRQDQGVRDLAQFIGEKSAP